MRRLSWKLAAALLLVVVVSIGLMAFLTNRSTTRQFEQYISRGNTAYAQTLAADLGGLYAAGQGWDEIGKALDSLPLSSGEWLVVADSAGTIVADTAGEWLGREADDAGLDNGVAIMAAGETVGSLYLLTDGTAGMGMGHMRGRSGAAMTAMMTTPEEDFLNRVNASLWQAGLIAVAVALVIGLVLTRQITHPVRALITGVRHIARGELDYRVKVKSQDEIGELASSFNTMASTLEKTEQSRRQITADVAHELRTPLTVIEGTVDGIMDGVFQPDRERLQNIKDQSAMLTRLIGDLRDLSLAETGQLKLDMTTTNISELLNRTVSRFAAPAQEKGVQLTLNADADLPETKADPTRLEQVIGNLVTNAIRHTPAGGSITVAATGSRQGIEISVTDTGEGIAAADLPHVFERFYRSGSSRSRKEGGTGLGLAIVKQMVEAHGGKVWAESRPGAGSSFHILLPLSPA